MDNNTITTDNNKSDNLFTDLTTQESETLSGGHCYGYGYGYYRPYYYRSYSYYRPYYYRPYYYRSYGYYDDCW